MSRTSDNYGAPQGGGITYDIAVRAEGQSTTTNYDNLNYSTVSSVQYGTFLNGTENASIANGDIDNATNICSFEFDTEGIYQVEFSCYADGASGGFSWVQLTRSGQSSHEDIMCYQGIYASYNRKTGTAIRKFYPGDKVKFFNRNSTPSPKFSKIVIAKLG